jgi:hypothetical protein
MHSADECHDTIHTALSIISLVTGNAALSLTLTRKFQHRIPFTSGAATKVPSMGV